jgi:hypothetical protein
MPGERVQRKTEPVRVGLPRIDGLALGPIEAEKRLEFGDTVLGKPDPGDRRGPGQAKRT